MLIVIAALVIYAWRSSSPDQPYTEQRFTLDSSVTLSIYDMPEAKAKSAAAAAFKKMDEIGSLAYPDSGKVATGNKTVKRLIAKSLASKLETDGAFDPNIGAVTELWGVGLRNYVPTDSEIEAALGQKQLDFGGIAKGFAIDEAKKLLRQQGVKSALISAVSSTSALGAKPGGEEWKVGVENPRPGGGPAIVAELKVPAGANVSTSGDYQKYFMEGARRYHHIFDPKTGRPAEGVMSVTVVTDLSAADADVLSTALFVMGPREGEAFLQKGAKQFSGTGAIFITGDGKITATKGMKPYLIRASKSISKSMPEK